MWRTRSLPSRIMYLYRPWTKKRSRTHLDRKKVSMRIHVDHARLHWPQWQTKHVYIMWTTKVHVQLNAKGIIKNMNYLCDKKKINNFEKSSWRWLQPEKVNNRILILWMVEDKSWTPVLRVVYNRRRLDSAGGNKLFTSEW